MKRIAAVLFILCFCKCSTRNSESLVTENVDSLQWITLITNESEIYPPSQIPEGFVLDTFQQFDNTKKVGFFISIPISNIKEIDSIVKLGVEAEKNEFIADIGKPEDGFISYFYFVPISVYKDEKIISFSFELSFYYAASMHPVSFYKSFNFDAKTKKQIYFDNYFLIKSKTDFFTNVIAPLIRQDREGIDLWIDDGIDELKTIKDFDFNIEKDTVSFNFSDYEIACYAEGLIQAKIHKKELYNKIRTNYR